MKLTMKLVTALASLLIASTSFALDYDFAGTFQKDNDVLRFNFTVGAPSNVTVFSSSWVKGGFDPILAIWDNQGNKMYQQDDGGFTGTKVSNGVTYDLGVWDSLYSVNLSAGNYFATIAQYSNFSKTDQFSDGFEYDGNPDFTKDLGYGSQPFFNGVYGGYNDPRTGDWAFHLLNVEQANVVDPNAPVPEPSTFILLGAGLGGLALYRRKMKK